MVSGYLLLKASLSDARPTKKKTTKFEGGKFTRKNATNIARYPITF